MPETLRSLTYVSEAREAMSEAEFTQLGLQAGRLNALDGITGLLVFNGARFCQTVEGAPAAIDSLLGRLNADPRHCAINVIDDQLVTQRRFRSWDMQLLVVPSEREAALDLARTRLDTADVDARAKIYETVEGAFQ